MRTAILGAALVLGACTPAGGESGDAQATAQRNFQVGAFDRVALSGSHDVVVTVGGPPSVRAEGDPKALDRLEIVAEGGQLSIGSRRRSSWNWFGGLRRRVIVHVTVPALAGASIGGSGEMRVDRVESERFAASVAGSGDMRIGRVEGEQFSATVSGSGDLQVANIRTAEARFSVTGSGAIRASGAAQRTSSSVTGSGELDLSGLETADASVALTGSGDISVRATRTASVELRGSGDVSVAGPARCSVNKSGSGDVHCGG